MEILIVIVVIIGAVVVFSAWSTAEKRKRLMAKYGDAAIVERLMRKEIWQGQTAQQVTDAIGQPKAVDHQVLKTKEKEIWKYQPSGKNRYDLRVIIENGVVVGWDKKGG